MEGGEGYVSIARSCCGCCRHVVSPPALPEHLDVLVPACVLPPEVRLQPDSAVVGYLVEAEAFSPLLHEIPASVVQFPVEDLLRPSSLYVNKK